MTERSIVLLRHAKAEQPDGIADLDRPLTDRGHADAAAAGAWLTDSDNLPDLVLCSPATRTRQTWHGVAVAMAGSADDSGPGAGAPEVRYEPALYASTVGDLLTVLRDTDDAFETVLVVGHNPSISDLSALLDPAGGESGDGDGLRTSGIAVHRFVGSWDDLAEDSAELTGGSTARG